MFSKIMAELFNVKVNTINYHLKEVFFNNELNENSVIRIFRITTTNVKDYFDELLVKVKEIMASERRLYKKISDI